MEPTQSEQPPLQPTEEPNQDPTPSTDPMVPETVEPATAPATPVAPVSSVASAAVAVNPGKTLGIVSFVLSLVGIGLVGLILGIIAKSKSKKAGLGNGFALAGIIIGIVNIIVVSLITVATIMGAVALVSKCNDLGPGTHIDNGVTVTCGGENTNKSY